MEEEIQKHAKRFNRPARVVIVGTGFGGIYTYLGLHKHLHNDAVQAVLINETDRFEFIPMIHETATGTLQPSHITQPVRTVPQCCMDDFIEGRVIAVDADTQIVTVCQDTHDIPDQYKDIPVHKRKEIQYDFLVVAIGSETHYFGVPGAKEYSLPLKTVEDAKNIKNTLVERFEQAQHLDKDEDKQDVLRFVVVGGGPTGVEIAGELGDIIADELSDAFPDCAHLASVVIVERGTQLVAGLGESFSKKTEAIIEKMSHIYVMFETSVVSVTKAGVETDKGVLRSATVIWAAGVRGRDMGITTQKSLQHDPQNRIVVQQTLNTAQYDNVFVIGDKAHVENKDGTQAYPMRAQFAVREGKMVAKNIAHIVHGEELEPFSFKEKGFIISIGKGGALAEVYGIRFSGWFAWWIYRGAYLFSILGWRAKFRMGLEWVLNAFLPRDISKL